MAEKFFALPTFFGDRHNGMVIRKSGEVKKEKQMEKKRRKKRMAVKRPKRIRPKTDTKQAQATAMKIRRDCHVSRARRRIPIVI